jgi:excisionase family DNA binding protein
MSVSEYLPPGETFAVWQLAKMLNCHRSHLVHLIEAGEIVAFDLRGKKASRSTMRVPRNSIVEFLEKRQVIAAATKLGRRGDKHARKH